MEQKALKGQKFLRKKKNNRTKEEIIKNSKDKS